MLKFRDLKIYGIKKLKEHLDSSKNLTRPYNSFEIDLDPLNLISLIDFIHVAPLCYIKDKKNRYEFLSAGCILQCKTEDLDEIIDHASPDLYLFGGERFDKSRDLAKEWSFLDNSYFFLPRICFRKRGSKLSLFINYKKEELQDEGAEMNLLLELESLLSFQQKEQSFKIFDYKNAVNEAFPKKDIWDDMIHSCIASFSNSSCEKVVMARKNIIKLDDDQSARYIFHKLILERPDSYVYYLELEESKAFISLSPEKLFTLGADYIQTDAIAGTRSRGITELEDEKLGIELLQSKKDVYEHKIVVDTILENLNEISDEVETKKISELLKLKYVQHIISSYQAKLKERYKISTLLKMFHPTPAVGGRPWSLASKYIKDLEPFDRGLYAAPVGFVSNEETEFIVGIRSALIEHKNIHIYGGAGIVPGSIAEDEWIETQNKMKNFLISL